MGVLRKWKDCNYKIAAEKLEKSEYHVVVKAVGTLEAKRRKDHELYG